MTASLTTSAHAEPVEACWRGACPSTGSGRAELGSGACPSRGSGRAGEGRCGHSLRIAGYAALFGIADGARDTIRPGAFRRTLLERRNPLPLYWQHRPDRRIGWVENVSEDQRGLRVVARIDNTQRRAATLLMQRAVDGLSFGYEARRWRRTEAGRELADIELFEVSVVTHPLQYGARVHWTT